MNKKIIIFAAAIVAQLFILAAVPARQMYARCVGKPVLLRTVPVDPYSVMSGYYVTLNYEISAPGSSGLNRRWNSENEKSQTWQNWHGPVYVVLQSEPNGVYKAVSWHQQFPDKIAPDAVIIKGRTEHGWRIEYGIESYYIPENMRKTIDDQMRQYRSDIKIEVKIDSFGNAAISKLFIGPNEYNY